MPAVLVVGAGIAGLTTAYRLARSDWEVVVVDHAPGPRCHAFTLYGIGAQAAGRMRLPQSLWGGEVRYGVGAVAFEQDRWGVTVTLTDGVEYWFDLVVGADGAKSTVRSQVVDGWSCGQIAVIGDAAWGADPDAGASLAVGGAELFGDALDIFTDTHEALVWWERKFRPLTTRLAGARPKRGTASRVSRT